MSERELALAALERVGPRTHAALTHLVPAMADAKAKAGKRSLFGKDLGFAAYEKFLATLQDTFVALYLDGLIESGETDARLLQRLSGALDLFERAYPNWPDAYAFRRGYFDIGIHPQLGQVLAHARGTLVALERPTLLRRRQ